jgi:hypothetical protein
MRKQLPKISEEDNLELENMPLNTKDESILVEPQVIKILPVILDACCGGRMFWFNKKHPSCIYIDQRVAPKGHYKEKPNHSVEPDIVMDFREMDFPDNTFKLVVFDPPHLATLGKTSKFAKDYGKLDKSTWRDDLRRGFDECWRVLDDYGVLIFKWNEYEISKKDVLAVIGKQPLFGHPVWSKVQTHWFTFMKIPDRQNSL